MVLLTAIVWYAVGFVAAGHLVRRGHDRTTWTMAAALTGSLVAVAAIVMAVMRSVRARPALEMRSTPAVAVVVDRTAGPSIASLSHLDPSPTTVALVGLVSHEASSGWIHTGELAEVDARLAAHRARIPLPTSTTVVSGPPGTVAEACAQLYVVPRDRMDRSRRHDAWRVLSAARDAGSPVLSPVSGVAGATRTLSGAARTIPDTKATA